MNLEGSAAYLRQQVATKVERESLYSDAAWLQVYALCIIADELEKARVLMQARAPEGAT